MNTLCSIQSFLILIFVALFYGYQYIMRSLPARFDNEICSALNASDFFVSSSQSIYLIIYSIMQIISAYAFQRFGVKRVLLFSLFSICIATALYAIAWNIYIALIARIITATFSATMLLGGVRICDVWFPPQFSGSIICFMVFTGMLAGNFSTLLPTLGYEWRFLFLVSAFLGLFLVGLGALILNENGIYPAQKSDNLSPFTSFQIFAMLIFCIVFFILVQSEINIAFKISIFLMFGAFIVLYFGKDIYQSEFFTPAFASLIFYSAPSYLALGALADVLLTKYVTINGISNIYPGDSSIYIGMLAGVLVWGPVADYFGFKTAIIMSGILSILSILVIYLLPVGIISIIALVVLGFATGGSPLPIAFAGFKAKNTVLARAVTNCSQMIGNAIFLALLPFFFDQVNYDFFWLIILGLLSTALTALAIFA